MIEESRSNQENSPHIMRVDEMRDFHLARSHVNRDNVGETWKRRKIYCRCHERFYNAIDALTDVVTKILRFQRQCSSESSKESPPSPLFALYPQPAIG